MLKKIKPYLHFWNKKPIYHVEVSAYGGLRMDIDKYYSLDENKEELKDLNNSFGKMFTNKEEKEKSIS